MVYRILSEFWDYFSH